jgi:hypothetical protein
MINSDTSAPQQTTEVPVAFQRQPIKGRGTAWDPARVKVVVA